MIAMWPVINEHHCRGKREVPATGNPRGKNPVKEAGVQGEPELTDQIEQLLSGSCFSHASATPLFDGVRFQTCL